MAESPAGTSSAKSARLRLLVVDDDLADRQIVARALARSGLDYELSEALNATDGLSLLESGGFDCALIDMNLPEGNSLDFFADLMARPSSDKPSIVMMTGGGDQRTAARAIQLGAQEYLVKSDLGASSLRLALEGALHKSGLNRQLQERESELLKMSFYDRLTGLPNRNLYFDRLNQQLRLATRAAEEFAVLNIDLDRFKQVNDDHGHQVGDLLLVQAAERLSGALRESDTVARFGGDEFTALLPATGRDGAERASEAVITAFSEPFMVDGRILSIGASIGIAIFPRHGRDCDLLLSNSDRAMYQAKQQGAGYAVCAPHEAPRRARRRNLARDLARALAARDEIFLEYQPQIDLETGAVSGAEALVRWRHPAEGLLSPARFLPVAERSAPLIESLTWYVVGEAMGQMARWHASGLALNLSVNLSPMVLDRPALVARIENLTGEFGIDAGSICLEVTETAIMRNVTSARRTLERLKSLGCEISIDDFGTGYSSLRNLRDLPIDEIKIDGSFVGSMDVETDDRIIVDSVLALGRAFGVRVIAEGIESEPVRAQLQALGCRFGQGYHFSPALPAEAFEAWVRSRPVLPIADRGFRRLAQEPAGSRGARSGRSAVDLAARPVGLPSRR